MASFEFETGNMSTACATELPDAGDYLRDLHIVYVVFIGITGVLTAVTLIMYVETVVFFFRNLYNWKPKDKAKWVLAVYPIHTLTSFISLMVPRSSHVNELIAACYFSVCIYQFVTMLIGHYGGAKRMSHKLAGNTVRLSTTPCCCCCKCLPTPDVTRHSIHMVQTLVIQYAVAGPILAYCMAIVWANTHYYENPFKDPAAYMSMVNTISSIVALWGMSVTFGVAEPFLMHAHIKPKFYCVQFVNFFTNIQSFIIEVFVMSGVIKCDAQLNAAAVGVRYHNIILIFEMFAVWLVARYYYRRDIKEIPIEDQVYVDTHNVGTSISGSLNRTDNSNSDYQMYGPTSAQELMDQDWKRLSLEMAIGSKAYGPVVLDPSAGEHRKYQLKSAIDTKIAKKKKNSPYEPVQFKKKDEKPKVKSESIGVGPDSPPYEPTYAKVNKNSASIDRPRNSGTAPGRLPNDNVDPGDVDVDFPNGIKDFPTMHNVIGPEYHASQPTPKEMEALGPPQDSRPASAVPKPVRQRSKQGKHRWRGAGSDTVSESGSSVSGSTEHSDMDYRRQGLEFRSSSSYGDPHRRTNSNA